MGIPTIHTNFTLLDWINSLDDYQKEWAETVSTAILNNSKLIQKHKRLSKVKAYLIACHCASLLDKPRLKIEG